MGESLSKAVEPEQLVVFKKISVGPSTQFKINIPELPENRVRTDRKFLIVFIVVILLLMPFLIYTLANSNIGRYFGYDPCGNVCGEKNSHDDRYSCSGRDFTAEKYLQYDEDVKQEEDGWLLTARHCTSKCTPGYYPVFGRCVREKSHNEPNDADDLEVVDYLQKSAWKITLACFLSLGVAMLMLFLFKIATAVVVWAIIGGSFVSTAIFVGWMWYLYFTVDTNSNSRQSILVYGIVFSILWLVGFVVFLFLYRKILLVIQLLKEATKAAFDMPTLLFVPILTFLAELVIYTLLIVTSVYMFSAGILSPLQGDFLYYKQNPVMLFAVIFNFWVAFWAIQFVVGVQYMVIAGAVSKWYFYSDKRNLDSPILSSASVVFKFHLGSIAFGSMIITLVAIIKAILVSMSQNARLKYCINSLMGTLETFIKFLSKNSYIMTAMHGKPFYKSGKRAAKIIFQNAVNVASINYIGDFVLGMAQVLVVLISLLLTVGILKGSGEEKDIVIYVIVFIVSLIIAVTAFSIFETTVDTIFLCFCEDTLLNDGMARPYAMSRNLMEFVENSKTVYGVNKH